MTNNSPFRPNRFDNLRFNIFIPGYLRLLKDIADFCYPTQSKNKIRMFIRSLYWANYSGQWFQQIARSSLLMELVKQDKNLAEKLHRHVLRMDNPRRRCLQILSEHYVIAERLIKSTLLQQALLYGGLLLSRIAINSDLGFDLILGYGGFPGKEGELAIIMRQLGQSNDLARLSFSFISKEDGYIVFIGGLQGFAAPNSREIVAQASKACSGLSPKRLVMEALFALAKQVGASAILGVSDEQHISRKKVAKHFSYDNYWLEFNGLRNEDGDYSLPLVPIHKDLMDVPTKRRAKYRRQHALLETIHMDTFNVCSAQDSFARSSSLSQDFIGLDTSLKIPVSVVQANTLA